MVSPQAATVVMVGFAEKDRDYLQRLLNGAEGALGADFRWAVQTKGSVAAALSALRRDPVGVMLCDRDEFPDEWKELLSHFAYLSAPPCLIVTSRLADDILWAEALNLGAYDVLALPFDRDEVVRTVTLAHSHWQGPSHPQAARSVA